VESKKIAEYIQKEANELFPEEGLDSSYVDIGVLSQSAFASGLTKGIELMGKFSEWKEKEGWYLSNASAMLKSVIYWTKEGATPIYTTEQLIELFLTDKTKEK